MVAGRREPVNATDRPPKNVVASNHAIGVGGKLKIERCAPILPAVGSADLFLRLGSDPYGLARRGRSPAILGRRGAVVVVAVTKLRGGAAVPLRRVFLIFSCSSTDARTAQSGGLNRSVCF
jgi:hypothetical protein